MFAGKKSAQIREILISESAWEEMTCLFAPSLAFDSTGVPLANLLQQGMLTNILTCSVMGNLLWLGVNLALRGDSVFKNL
ncbi:hypothetical protein HMPREF1308_05076 [Klebsiella pneumoniae subsp. pneumoniae WGLW5]|nr:hypothetical protein HMPREF1308_05076 [Klebsiella pneumoniae subsp. pneumoniae WGLW5]